MSTLLRISLSICLGVGMWIDSCLAAIITINANGSDNHVTDSTVIPSGGFQDGSTATAPVATNTDAIRIGAGGDGTQNLVGIFAFALPTLAAGEAFTNASFSFNLAAKDGTLTGFNADVYALSAPRAAPTLLASDFYIGPYGNDPTDATPLQDNFLVSSSTLGTNTASVSAGNNFLAFLSALYNGNPNPSGGPGQYLFLRINPDVDPTNGNNRYRIAQSNTATPATITLTSGVIPEPGTTAIALLGGLIGCVAWKRRSLG